MVSGVDECCRLLFVLFCVVVVVVVALVSMGWESCDCCANSMSASTSMSISSSNLLSTAKRGVSYLFSWPFSVGSSKDGELSTQPVPGDGHNFVRARNFMEL